MSNRRTRQRRARRQARPRLPWRKIAAVAVLAAALPAIALAAWFLVAGSDDGPDGPPRAVIVDQLSLTAPNPNFQDEATEMLERAGYLVDYVPGEDVTVDYCRDLPKQDFEFVLLRAHAAGRDFGGEGCGDDVSLFTSERVSPTKYAGEQRNRRLKGVGYTASDLDESNLYFGIPRSFVESSMRGDFGGATVPDGVRRAARPEPRRRRSRTAGQARWWAGTSRSPPGTPTRLR